MKKTTLSLVAVLATSTFALAGGDIAPVEPVVQTPVVVDEVAAPSTGGLYLGAGFGLIKSDSNFLDVNHNGGGLPDVEFNDDYSAMMFQAGYAVNKYISVEARYWVGLTDNEFTITGNTFNHDAAAWGFYVKPTYPVSSEFNIYGLLGYGKAIVRNVEIGNVNEDFDIDGLSWGIGASYTLTENFSVFADYVDFNDDTVDFAGVNTSGTFDHAFDSINLGVTYQF